MTLKQIQSLTEQAIKASELERLELQNRNNEKELLRINQAKTWAEEKFKEALSKIEGAAARAQYAIVVAELKSYSAVLNNGNRDNPKFNLKEDGLKWEYFVEKLKEFGFKVSIVYAFDGGGIHSWYNINVDWKPVVNTRKI